MYVHARVCYVCVKSVFPMVHNYYSASPICRCRCSNKLKSAVELFRRCKSRDKKKHRQRTSVHAPHFAPYAPIFAPNALFMRLLFLRKRVFR